MVEMARKVRDYSWLPDHQLHVASTLGHVDALIEKVADVLFDYLRQGPLEFENVPKGDRANVTVKSVAPLPAAVARFTADVMTQLRAALEHTIYAELEHELGRSLTSDEARSAEMPAAVRVDGFEAWLRHRTRRTMAPFADGSQLVRRIRDLQPFERRDVDEHPLRVLVEHTNAAKHRTPAVAATMLGVVIPDEPAPSLVLASEPDRALESGDVLASGPLYQRVPLSIWPKVSIQRPHMSTWHVLIHEVAYLEDWVRRIAIPVLVAGTHTVDELPPGLDGTRGHADVRVALQTADQTPAAERANRRMQAVAAREGLEDTLVLHPAAPPREVLHVWVAALTDDEVLKKQGTLEAPVRVRDHRGVEVSVRRLLDEVEDHARGH